MRLNTVNVIEFVDDAPIGITSYEDNEEGNRLAEIVFHDLVKQNVDNVLDEDISVGIEDGYFTSNNWSVFLAHSS